MHEPKRIYGKHFTFRDDRLPFLSIRIARRVTKKYSGKREEKKIFDFFDYQDINV